MIPLVKGDVRDDLGQNVRQICVKRAVRDYLCQNCRNGCTRSKGPFGMHLVKRAARNNQNEGHLIFTHKVILNFHACVCKFLSQEDSGMIRFV